MKLNIELNNNNHLSYRWATGRLWPSRTAGPSWSTWGTTPWSPSWGCWTSWRPGSIPTTTSSWRSRWSLSRTGVTRYTLDYWLPKLILNTPPEHSNQINEPHQVAVAIFFRLFTSMNAEFDWFLHQELSFVKIFGSSFSVIHWPVGCSMFRTTICRGDN